MTADQPKKISERVYFKKEKSGVEIIITQQISRLKETLLLTWLLAWTFCGLVFLSYWLESSGNERIFLMICLAFWAYFWVRIGKAFLWRKKGKEIIIINRGKLLLRNAIGKSGKVNTFLIQNIHRFGEIKIDQGNFFQSLDFSFWVVGGDRFGFDYMGQKIRLGKQLSDKEVNVLGRLIEKSLREFKQP